MNTLSIAFLVLCATAAYASVIPENSAVAAEAPSAAQPFELLEGAESKHGGGYNHGGSNHGGYNHGGYNHGGGGGYHRGGGGGGRHGGGHGGGHWGK